MQLKRISGRKRVDRVLRHGKIWRGKHMSIHFLPGAPKHPLVDPDAKAVYAGVSASAKIDKSAVKRNRMRRRTREALRTFVKDGNFPVLQLIIRPRSSSLKCQFEELNLDISTFFSSLTRATRTR